CEVIAWSAVDVDQSLFHELCSMKDALCRNHRLIIQKPGIRIEKKSRRVKTRHRRNRIIERERYWRVEMERRNNRVRIFHADQSNSCFLDLWLNKHAGQLARTYIFRLDVIFIDLNNRAAYEAKSSHGYLQRLRVFCKPRLGEAWGDRSHSRNRTR